MGKPLKRYKVAFTREFETVLEKSVAQKKGWRKTIK